MFRGLYTAASGANINQHRIDVVSNNISNMQTNGFKKDVVIVESFEDALISKQNGSLNLDGLSNNIEMNMENRDGYYYGELNKGYFKIETPTGASYHNKANFIVAEDGYLKTFNRNQEGNPDGYYGYNLLGSNGPIYVGDGELNIDETGNVLVDGELVDNLVTKPHHSVIGTMNSGVKLKRIDTNFEQGQFQRTENPLDFAIRGEGFFVVETDEGTRYTRDGSFKLNDYDELVTSEGYRVQGQYGDIIIDGEEMAVDSQGNILIDGEVEDAFEILNIENIRDLRKEGDSLFRIEENIEPIINDFTGQVLQGNLELSNVDPIKEMVEMMTLYRGYESSQKVIKAYDETIGKAVTEVGKV